MIDYGRMSTDELVEHFIDERGLADFIDLQYKNWPQEGDPHHKPEPLPPWDWRIISRDLMALSRGYLTFSPAYLKELYEMQSASGTRTELVA